MQVTIVELAVSMMRSPENDASCCREGDAALQVLGLVCGAEMVD